MSIVVSCIVLATYICVDDRAEPPPTFHNYLDDFLQAVRVFGFVSYTQPLVFLTLTFFLYS
jgi:hypothetical protein